MAATAITAPVVTTAVDDAPAAETPTSAVTQSPTPGISSSATPASTILDAHPPPPPPALTQPKVLNKRRLTLDEIDDRAEQADLSIEFVDDEVFEKEVLDPESGISWIVFFGDKFCGFCKRLTPKWLQIQNLAKKYNVLATHRLRIAKMDCTEIHNFCAEQGSDGYPTILFYHKGKLVEEYQSEHDITSLWDYVRSKADDIVHDRVKFGVPPADVETSYGSGDEDGGEYVAVEAEEHGHDEL
ncbi:thioredoxin-like protein [Cladochytrium replicatum]|nr:thioredoxin-like protein [Cladochytrium replicatum]